jgi:NitT/TauT family transport system ATP-binding protein
MKPKIDVRGVSKTFQTGRGPIAVLDDISFSVAEGEFVAVIGPSGCGKSTLLGVLAGFERPDAGEVRVDDEPVREPKRTGIYIFQQPSLFPWLDLEGNLIFGLSEASSEARRTLVAHYIALVGL